MPAKKTPLQKYLSKPLAEFQRGTADCGAFVGKWINQTIGEDVIQFKTCTFGDLVRKARKTSITNQVKETVIPLGFAETKNPKDGDIVAYDHPDCFEGIGIGIMSGGKAVTRLAGPALHVTDKPNIIQAWTYSPPQS